MIKSGRSLRWVLAAFFFLPGTIFAVKPDEAVVGPDNFWHARSLSMGGAGTALAGDFGSVYWNPGGLALIRRKELHLSMGYFSKEETLQGSGVEGNAKISRLKLQSLGYAYPFPTRQGSLVVAFGYSRPKNFLSAYSGHAVGYSYSGSSEGHLSHWDMAVAADISQGISLGGSFGLVTGFEDYFDESNNGGALDTLSLRDDYIGFTASLGLSARLGGPWVAGANLELLNSLTVTRNSYSATDTTFEESGPFKTGMNLPIRASAGLAFTTTPLTVSADIEFTNWADFKFTEEGKVRYANELNNTLRAGTGIEWLIPGLPVKLRAGMGYQTLPAAKNGLDGPPLYYTGGLGALLDQVLAVDMGLLLNRRSYADGNEINTRTQGLLTLSYRF